MPFDQRAVGRDAEAIPHRPHLNWAARRGVMVGDAPAMTGIVTIQTALSFVTMPATLLLAQYLIGG